MAARAYKKPTRDPGHAARWCIHFRSIPDHDTCAVGVRYSAFGTFQTRPCFLDETGASKPGAVPCEKLRRPTPKEIAAHGGWLREPQ
jgi:hypothetical protein